MSGPFLRPGLQFRDNGYHVDVIISTHALIHTGCTYRASLYGASVANNGTIEITFLTGANYETHVEWSADTGGAANLQVIEGRTVSGGGAMTPRNKNRSLTRSTNGTAVSGAAAIDGLCEETLTSNPSTSTGGTVLDTHYFLTSGVGGGASPASGGSRDEWILAPSTQYTFILTNTNGTNKDLFLELEWYEHPRNSQQAHEVVI